MTRYVYDFHEGSADQKDLLGGKGANLAEMTNLGLPVPPGFTISTDACRVYLETGSEPDELGGEVDEHLASLEEKMGRTLGQADDPLLVSVRSGAKFSMPGMMETVLNIGLNDASVQGLAKISGSERFAWDSYRRLVQMFGTTVLDIERSSFDEALDDLKDSRGVETDVELEAADFESLVSTYKKIVKDATGSDFPQAPRDQLDLAVRAVFSSWNTERAKLYRRQERIPDDLGTAVNICSMVFGNLGDDSGTGVCFTRDPATRSPRCLRRLPAERPGRGRGRGHSQHVAADSAGGPGQGVVRRAAADHGDARAPLPRHVRHRVHRRARQAVDVADPGREAHRGGGVPGGDAVRGRGTDRQGRGAAPGHRRPAGQPDVPPVRQEQRPRADRQGHGREPRCRGRQGGLRLSHGRGVGDQGRRRDPRPPGDQPRRPARDDRGPWRADEPRRQDVARGRGGARHGAHVRGRRRGAPRRPSAATGHHAGRAQVLRGRRHLDRRHHG